MRKLRPGPTVILGLGLILLYSGIFLLSHISNIESVYSQNYDGWQEEHTKWEKENYYFDPVSLVSYLKERQNPDGYFVSNPDLMNEPAELNANSMKGARFSLVTLSELGSVDAIDTKAATDFIMSNYVEEGEFAGFKKTPDGSIGVRTTLDALMTLEVMNALGDPRLDIQKVEDFILTHQNPDGGFWDEDYSKYGEDSTLICTSFALRALGRIALYQKDDFDAVFKEKVKGFVQDNYNEGFGSYSNTPGGDPTDSYGIFRAFISLWWIGGGTDTQRREFVEENMDMDWILKSIESNYLHTATGAYCRKSRGHLDCTGESIKATHLIVWFLNDMGRSDLLDKTGLIRYTINQATDNGQYEDVYTLYAAILMLNRLDVRTEPIIEPLEPDRVNTGNLHSLAIVLIVLGIVSFGAGYFVHRRVTEIEYTETKYRRLITDINDGFLDLDERGSITFANDGLVKMFEYDDPEEVIGRPVLEFLAPEAREEISQNFEKGVKAGKFAEVVEVPGITKYGNTIYVEIKPVAIIDDEKVIGLRGVVRDVTKKKLKEIELRHRLLKFRLEDGELYLVKEVKPMLVLEAFKDLLTVGSKGFVLSRTTEADFKKEIEGDANYDFFWLTENPGENNLPPIKKAITDWVKLLPRTSVLLIDRLDYIITKIGFNELLGLVQDIRDISQRNSLITVMSVDPSTMNEKELSLLMKETRGIKLKHGVKLSDAHMQLLRYIYKQNNKGLKPSFTELGKALEISLPTVRTRVNNLVNDGQVKLIAKGNKKLLEITEEGLRLFTK